MRKCEKCGTTDNSSNTKRCPICGERMVEAMVQPVAQPQADYAQLQEQPSPQGSVEPQKKKESIWLKIGSSALVVVIAMAVKFGMGKIFERNQEKDALKELEKSIAIAEKYEAGEFSENGYSSEFWDMRFQADGTWKMADDSEMEQMASGLQESIGASVRASLEEMEASEKLKQKAIQTIRVNTEMGFYYHDSDDEIAGFGFMMSFNQPGANSDSDVAAMMEEMKNDLGFAATDTEIKKVTLAGKTYNRLSCKMEEDGTFITMNIYLRFKDGMLSATYLYYPVGMTEIEEAFESHITTY